MKSHGTRKRYLRYRREGVSATLAAKKVGIGYSTGNAWERYRRSTGSTRAPSKNGAPPRSKVEKNKKKILKIVRGDRRIKLREVKKELEKQGLKVSKSSISRGLKRWGVEKQARQWRFPGEMNSHGNALVPKRRKTKLAAHDEDIRILAGLGSTLREIVEELEKKFSIECTESAVSYRLRRLGVPLRNSKNKTPQKPLQELQPDKHRSRGAGRSLLPYLDDIVKWVQDDPETISLVKIADRLLERHGVKTSDATVCRVLNNNGIHLRVGRKPAFRENKKTPAGKTAKPAGAVSEGRSSLKKLQDKFPNADPYELAQSLHERNVRLNERIDEVGLEDPRNTSIRYCLSDVLQLIQLAVGSGRTRLHSISIYLQENQDTLSRMFYLPNGVPSLTVIRHVMFHVDSTHLSKVLLQLSTAPSTDPRKTCGFSADGQMFCGAKGGDRVTEPGLISILDQSTNQIVAAIPCGKGGAELQGLRDLLTDMKNFQGLDNAVITADALHGTAKTLSTISALGADFCIPIKRRKSKLSKALKSFINSKPEYEDYVEFEEQSRGRSEKRTYGLLLPDNDLLKVWKSIFKNEKHVPKLAQIIVECNVRNGKRSYRIFVLSKRLDMETAADIIRKHWGIENKVHYVADNRFGQDYIHAYTGNTAVNMGIMIRACINMVTNFAGELPNAEIYNRMEVNLIKNLQVLANTWTPAEMISK